MAPCREATEIVLASEVVGERLLEEKMEEDRSIFEWVRGLLSCRHESGQTLREIRLVCEELAVYSEGEVARLGLFKVSARTRRSRMANSTLFFAVQTSNNC